MNDLNSAFWGYSSFGMYPTQRDMARHGLEMYRSRELQNHAMRLDGQRALKMIEGLLSPDAAAQFREHYSGSRANQQLLGTLINANPMIANLFGGSSLNMAYGAHAMMQGATIGGITQYGSSALQNEMAIRLMSNIQAQYEMPGGFMSSRLQGMDRRGLGDLMAGLGMRGAFSGRELKLDGNFQKEISTLIEESATTLRILRDVFGDRGSMELMRIAEDLTGMTFAINNVKKMGQAIASIKNLSRSLGYDPQSVFEGVMGLSQMGVSAGLSQGASSQIALPSFQSALISQRISEQGRGRAAGPYIGFDATSAATQNQQLAMRAMLSDSGRMGMSIRMAAASGVLDGYPELKARALSGEAFSRSEQVNLARQIEAATGVHPSVFSSGLTNQQIINYNAETVGIGGVMDAYVNTQALEDLNNVLGRSNIFGGDRKGFEIASSLFQSVGQATMGIIASKLLSGDIAGAQEILDNAAPGSGINLSSISNAGMFGSRLMAATALIVGNEERRMQWQHLNREEMRQRKEMEWAAHVETVADLSAVMPSSFLSAATEGFMDKVAGLDINTAMFSILGENNIFDIVTDLDAGEFTQSEEEAAKKLMLASGVSLYDHFGGKEGLSAARASGALREVLAANNYAVLRDKNRSVVYNTKKAEEAKEIARRAHAYTRMGSTLGIDISKDFANLMRDDSKSLTDQLRELDAIANNKFKDWIANADWSDENKTSTLSKLQTLIDSGDAIVKQQVMSGIQGAMESGIIPEAAKQDLAGLVATNKLEIVGKLMIDIANREGLLSALGPGGSLADFAEAIRAGGK